MSSNFDAIVRTPLRYEVYRREREEGIRFRLAYPRWPEGFRERFILPSRKDDWGFDVKNPPDAPLYFAVRLRPTRAGRAYIARLVGRVVPTTKGPDDKEVCRVDAITETFFPYVREMFADYPLYVWADKVSHIQDLREQAHEASARLEAVLKDIEVPFQERREGEMYWYVHFPGLVGNRWSAWLDHQPSDEEIARLVKAADGRQVEVLHLKWRKPADREGPVFGLPSLDPDGNPW